MNAMQHAHATIKPHVILLDARLTTRLSCSHLILHLDFVPQVCAVEGTLTDAALLALRCVICAGGEDDEHLLLCDGTR